MSRGHVPVGIAFLRNGLINYELSNIQQSPKQPKHLRSKHVLHLDHGVLQLEEIVQVDLHSSHTLLGLSGAFYLCCYQANLNIQ